jgi:hypothetical protein
MSALIKYDAARYALQQAVEIDEVKDIRDKAEAMAAYARQAKDTEMIQWVTEIKVRAERRAGEMLASMEKHPGAKGTGSNQHEVRSHDVTAPKLADLGITKNESSRWQKLAAVPEDQFEQAVAAAKDIAGEVTTAAMLRAARAQDARPEAIEQITGKRPGAKPEHEPVEDETAEDGFVDNLTMLRDSLNAINEENTSLKKQIANYEAILLDDERAGYLDRLNVLTKENKTLEILNRGLTEARDRVMRENVSLRKQAEYATKKLKALDRAAA